MKKSLLVAALLAMGSVGFAQSADKTSETVDQKHCDKKSAACCEASAAKCCHGKSEAGKSSEASAGASTASGTASAIAQPATEPKESAPASAPASAK